MPLLLPRRTAPGRAFAAVFFAAVWGGGAATAADLQVVVHGPGGAPLPNAVVTVYPDAGSHAPMPPPAPLMLAQKDIAFSPYVLIVPLGAQVGFSNNDTVRHHVYSFSAPHRFELKLFGREDTRFERFDKPGVVALGCNIHDAMAAYVYVADTRFAAKTDAQGRVRIADLPAGAATVKVWHPLAKLPGGTLSKAVTIASAGTGDAVTLDVRPPLKGKQDH